MHYDTRKAAMFRTGPFIKHQGLGSLGKEGKGHKANYIIYNEHIWYIINLCAFPTLQSEPKPWCLINGPVQNMEAFLVRRYQLSLNEFKHLINQK